VKARQNSFYTDRCGESFQNLSCGDLAKPDCGLDGICSNQTSKSEFNYDKIPLECRLDDKSSQDPRYVKVNQEKTEFGTVWDQFSSRWENQANENIFSKQPAVSHGNFGGYCLCPNGMNYAVADGASHCRTLLCKGGIPGECFMKAGEWSGGMVECAKPKLDQLKNLLSRGTQKFLIEKSIINSKLMQAKIEKITRQIKDRKFVRDPHTIFNQITQITSIKDFDTKNMKKITEGDFFTAQNLQQLIPSTKNPHKFKSELLANLAAELQSNKQENTLINAFESWEDKQQRWEQTPAAKCLLTRKKH
jgi:hypothetical protein